MPPDRIGDPQPGHSTGTMSEMSIEPREIRPPTPSGGGVGRAMLRSAAAHPHAPVARQFVKFALVGVTNTLVFLGVYTLLFAVLGVYYLAASAIAFTAGAVNGFLLNRAWTFQGHVGDAFTPVRWTIVQGCGLALDELLLYLWVSGLGIDKLLAQAMAIVVVVVLTFFANRAWTFRGGGSAA
jgi:putative flippase GtrA